MQMRAAEKRFDEQRVHEAQPPEFGFFNLCSLSQSILWIMAYFSIRQTDSMILVIAGLKRFN